MVVEVRDAKGREVAYGDDFRFDPDPVVCFKVPDDGDYELEVRDSIYRGREDFIYRISVGELPFVTSAFPLGGREGEPLATTVSGWNLPGARLQTRHHARRPVTADGAHARQDRSFERGLVRRGHLAGGDRGRAERRRRPRRGGSVSLRDQRPDRQARRCRRVPHRWEEGAGSGRRGAGAPTEIAARFGGPRGGRTRHRARMERRLDGKGRAHCTSATACSPITPIHGCG